MFKQTVLKFLNVIVVDSVTVSSFLNTFTMNIEQGPILRYVSWMFDI